MSKYRVCECCGQKIFPKINCYSSGSGCLTLSWVYGKTYVCGSKTPEIVTASSKVTKSDARKYLQKKDNDHLVKHNWLPVIINGRCVLARHVKRTGPDRLSINGHTFYYKIDKSSFDGRAEEANMETTFPVRLKGKMTRQPMLNGSIRMVIRYFLNYEKELTPQFKGHKVLKGDL